MSKLKECKSCGTEVAKSAKICPKCGQKLKMGKFLKFLIGVVVIAVIATVFSPSEKDKEIGKQQQITELISAEASNLNPYGELADMFRTTSDYTKIQCDKKLEEIKGAIVQWKLPISEVSVDGDGYKIQTKSNDALFGGKPFLGAFIYVTPKNQEERTYIESLMEGDQVEIKGVLKDIGTFLGATIRPAIIIR